MTALILLLRRPPVCSMANIRTVFASARKTAAGPDIVASHEYLPGTPEDAGRLR
jgi:hypothetical protein